MRILKTVIMLPFWLVCFGLALYEIYRLLTEETRTGTNHL
jgi:hypothetical protein